jgi:hypothetical protein
MQKMRVVSPRTEPNIQPLIFIVSSNKEMQHWRGFPCFVEFLELTSVKKTASQSASQTTAYARR